MIKNIKRFQRLLTAHANARFYGVPYFRAASFRMPRELGIHGERQVFRYLDDEGSRADFFVCFIYDEYRLRTFPANIRVVVDVGGNQGFFALAARGRFPCATIHVYEPNREDLGHILPSNARVAGASIFWEAVGKSAASVELVRQHTSNLTIVRPADASTASVSQVAFADVVLRAGGQIDLLKLDCEGAEWEIIDSPAMAHVQAVVMEYHLWARSGSRHEDATSLLADRGFRIDHQSRGPDWGYVIARRPDTHAPWDSRKFRMATP